MIFDITPSAPDKHYGRVLNEYIRCFPDDAWIIIRDQDTQYLHHESTKICYEAIADNPQCDLFSCATNRAWGQGFSNDPNILNHHKLAYNRDKKYTTIRGIVPAFFWMFPKRLWIDNPFDDYPIIHGGKSFDTRWTQGKAWNMLRIDHLYVFHFYRLHKHHRNYAHLI